MPNRLLEPWSLPTAARSPDELQMFLSALREIEGNVWNPESQILFQIILIRKYRHCRYNAHFFTGLNSIEMQGLLANGDSLPFAEAERLLRAKGYADPTRRSRIAFKSLERLGFARVNPDNGLVEITPSGRQLLRPGADFGDVFLSVLLKWQVPNPIEPKYPARLGYRIKPFVGTLHLIRQVNLISSAGGLEANGLSFDEFDAFVPTLIDWQKIGLTSRKVVEVRIACQGLKGEKRESKQRSFIEEHLKGFNTRRLRTYGEHIRQYFRLTRFIRLPPGGRSVELEPRRDIEITALLGY